MKHVLHDMHLCFEMPEKNGPLPRTAMHMTATEEDVLNTFASRIAGSAILGQLDLSRDSKDKLRVHGHIRKPNVQLHDLQDWADRLVWIDARADGGIA